MFFLLWELEITLVQGGDDKQPPCLGAQVMLVSANELEREEMVPWPPALGDVYWCWVPGLAARKQECAGIWNLRVCGWDGTRENKWDPAGTRRWEDGGDQLSASRARSATVTAREQGHRGSGTGTAVITENSLPPLSGGDEVLKVLRHPLTGFLPPHPS